MRPEIETARTSLSAHWLVTSAPEGGTCLRTAGHGRGFLIAIAAVLALCWIADLVHALATGQAAPLGTSWTLAIGIAVMLSAFALWCAFGDESWRADSNCLEHRVGIFGWMHVRRYHNATLEIVERSDKYGRTFFRLYAVHDGMRHFLIERRLPELSAWADVVAAETGWQRRDR